MASTIEQAYQHLAVAKNLLDKLAAEAQAQQSAVLQPHARPRKQRGDIRQNMRRGLSKLPMHQLIDRADWYAQFIAEAGSLDVSHSGNVIAVLDEFIRRASWAQITT